MRGRMLSRSLLSSCHASGRVYIRPRILNFIFSRTWLVAHLLVFHSAFSHGFELPTINSKKIIPSCVILDLDHTLWNRPRFRKGPPFAPLSNGTRGIQAASGEILDLFPNVREILPWLNDNDIKIGFVSSTHRPKWAQYFLETLRIQEDGDKTVLDFCKDQRSICIQDGPKIQHIRQISKILHVQPQEILYFDDNVRQIQRAKQSGIISVHCPKGLCWDRLEEGINLYAKLRSY